MSAGTTRVLSAIASSSVTTKRRSRVALHRAPGDSRAIGGRRANHRDRLEVRLRELAASVLGESGERSKTKPRSAPPTAGRLSKARPVGAGVAHKSRRREG